MSLGNLCDNFAGVAVLGILGPEGSLFIVLDHQANKFHQVTNVEHATAVIHLGEHRELAGKLAQQRVIALAVLAKDHGRAKDDHLEGVAIQGAQAVFCLDLAIAIAVGRVHRSILVDHLLFANGSAVAIHNGAAHEHKLLYASFFGLGGAGYGKVRVDCIIELGTFLANGAVIAMCNASHMVHNIVLAKVVLFPGLPYHVESRHLVHASELRFRKVVGKACANVAVSAGDEDVDHLFSCLCISPVPPSTTPSLLSTLAKVPKKHLQSKRKL